MRFHYYVETDSLYIDLVDRASADSGEMTPGVLADFDSEGRLVGIAIDHASQVADLTRLETDCIPLSSVVMTATG